MRLLGSANLDDGGEGDKGQERLIGRGWSCARIAWERWLSGMLKS